VAVEADATAGDAVSVARAVTFETSSAIAPAVDAAGSLPSRVVVVAVDSWLSRGMGMDERAMERDLQ
jgi:hypothetical protein